MIINLWSTPRTGSVWYSKHLGKIKNSIVITEMFNRSHMNMYYYPKDNNITNHHEYFNGCFYKDFYVEDGLLKIKKIYRPRTRTVDEEEKYLQSLLNEIDFSKNNLIMHNHVMPIKEEIRKLLTNMGENIYIYRKSKRDQLCSYAIAIATKSFVSFTKTHLPETIVNDIEPVHLYNLMTRIKFWDSLEKNNVIAYEDIEFYNGKNLPIKQNTDYRNKLSNKMLNIINDLADDYDKNYKT